MKLLNITGDNQTKPFIISMHPEYKEIKNLISIGALVIFDQSLKNAVAKVTFAFKQSYYPSEQMSWGSQGLMISTGSAECYDDLLKILNEFNNKSKQIYMDKLQSNSNVNEADMTNYLISVLATEMAGYMMVKDDLKNYMDDALELKSIIKKKKMRI